MVQYEVTVNFTARVSEFFNVDSRKFILEFHAPASGSEIEKKIFEKVPDQCVDYYEYKEIVTILPGDIVWVTFHGRDGSFSIMKEVSTVCVGEGTCTVPITEHDIQLLGDNLVSKIFASYRNKNKIVFSLSDCTEIARRKYKATVKLATASDIEYYKEGLEREEIARNINKILMDYFEDGYHYNQYIHTTEELKNFLTALQTFVKKYVE